MMWLCLGSSPGTTGANSERAPNGAPDTLRRPTSVSCSSRSLASQRSIRIRMRRVTRYVPPRIQAGSPSATHTFQRIAAAVGGVQVVGAVLEPHQVAGRCARPGPSRTRAWDQRAVDDPAPDPGQRADGVERDLGVVGAGLDADVASAPGRRRAGRRETRAGRRAPPAAAPATRTGRRRGTGPNPIVTVSRDAGRPYASPVSTGAEPGSPPTGPTGSPSHIRAAASDHARRSPARSARDPATSKLVKRR